jgi:hypothetical protein
MTSWIDEPNLADATGTALLDALVDAYPEDANDLKQLWRRIGMPISEFPLSPRPFARCGSRSSPTSRWTSSRC